MWSMLLSRIGGASQSPKPVQLVNVTGNPVRLLREGDCQYVLLPVADLDASAGSSTCCSQQTSTGTIVSDSGSFGEVTIEVGANLPPVRAGVIYVISKSQYMPWLVMKRTDMRILWLETEIEDVGAQKHTVYTKLATLREADQAA